MYRARVAATMSLGIGGAVRSCPSLQSDPRSLDKPLYEAPPPDPGIDRPGQGLPGACSRPGGASTGSSNDHDPETHPALPPLHPLYSRKRVSDQGGATVPDMPTGQLIRLYRIDRKKSLPYRSPDQAAPVMPQAPMCGKALTRLTPTATGFLACPDSGTAPMLANR